MTGKPKLGAYLGNTVKKKTCKETVIFLSKRERSKKKKKTDPPFYRYVVA